MRMITLAMQNVKSSFQNYLAVILSMSFTILILLNFQNVVHSDIFDGLGGANAEYIGILIQVISIVLCCFMFFFLWYAENVFLTKRKKEMGVYVFMGLTNQNIGMLFLIETVLNGVFALLLGIVSGIVTTHLFQMILLAVSDIAVEISFRFSPAPILITAGIYSVMYLLFAVKGYISIVRSSVLDMVSASRKKEAVIQNRFLLLLKTVFGLGSLSVGYYMAIKEGGQEVMGNVLAAVVLVIIGIYLLFGGALPALLLGLAKQKRILYRHERNLWVNQLIFQMKKNYRTYAMTCVLLLCSVTALATGFAMKSRYAGMVHFRNTYTFQFLSNQKELDRVVRPLIEQDNSIAYASEISVLTLDASLFETRFTYGNYALLPWSQVKALAEGVGLEFDFAPPEDDEILKASHMYMLSLITDRSAERVVIDGKTYRQTADTNVPYLGYFQELMSFYIVNDAEYERLLPYGQEWHAYNYRIADLEQLAASADKLKAAVSHTKENDTAMAVVDPDSSDIAWIKVLYTICIFMFLVFVLAGGSIVFMKLYNDALEEKERYQILRKIGVSEKTLKKSIVCELFMMYAMPFSVMLPSAYFSVHALEKMMDTNLMPIYAGSVGVILAILLLFYWRSVLAYVKHTGVEEAGRSFCK